MKNLVVCILVVGMSLLASAPTAWAETAYVVDTIKVSVRSGPGNEQKSVGMVDSGSPVEVLKTESEWSLIRLGNGTEGYVLSRYLTPAPPAKFRLDQLQEKNKSLTAQAVGLQEENHRLKAENDRLAAVVSEGQKELSSLRNAFEAFKQEASDFTGLRARYDALADEMSQKKQTISQLESQANDLLNPNNLYWFLAGGGVLLVGFLTGFSAKRQRRRSSLV